MDLFVRESGPLEAPTLVLLHGGRMSGWSWAPVVERMLRYQRYRCLVPDLPQYGKSAGQGPFEMTRAAGAVADLIRSRAGGRAHLVGFSLGAQVGMQVLAAEPGVVDRAVLCGAIVNTLPGGRFAQRVAGRLARTASFRWMVNRGFEAREIPIPAANVTDYRQDLSLRSGGAVGHIVAASVGFAAPSGLERSGTPTLFLTGTKEWPVVRRRAAALARLMPNGTERVAVGMRHDWPLRHPDLFSRTVDAWLSRAALPTEIVAAPIRPACVVRGRRLRRSNR